MDTILVFAKDLSPWLFGLMSWFITGIDDFVIFSGIYHEAKTKRQKIEAVAGLISMVVIMLLLVVGIGWSISLLRPYTWIGGFLPLWIAIKTWIGWGSAKEPSKGTFFAMSFAGFGLHCTDDIIYNASIIADKIFTYQLWYLGGVLSGAVLMVVLSHYLSKRIGDKPKLRASVIFLVSGYILYPGIEMIIQMFK
ncbi:MAG: hypothetical protein ACD_71C00083G0003 [uncultured bacterium (gcode 4)]|uniref:Uncharacterized protein n=1 Tax=uncultured bacterium (gcode 4) TaxID=1234023 RepID=K1ZJK8_9BACT|nr:MAG: hypothetical protein ACD_71C00083G0003 [uncultured bacterium (gcode 4)]